MWAAIGKLALKFGSWCFAHKGTAVALIQMYQAMKAAEAAKAAKP